MPVVWVNRYGGWWCRGSCIAAAIVVEITKVPSLHARQNGNGIVGHLCVSVMGMKKKTEHGRMVAGTGRW